MTAAAPDPDARDDDAAHEAVTAVAVSVVRSGGFAGIPRRWRVQADEPDAAHWIALVEDCPWDDRADERADERSDGPDRFAWTVHATLPDAEHRADLAETQATGPWRTLIDAVRAASAPPSR